MHAAKTVINQLSDSDRLSLVTYHDHAKVELTCSLMTPSNKQMAKALVDGLCPLSCTNLWDGLDKAMQVIKNSQKLTAGLATSILLLTDGCPNVVPPRGHLPMLQRFQDENPSLVFSLNTFGFGYSLMSKLLMDLASVGGGTYSFIPDSGFVGTGK